MRKNCLQLGDAKLVLLSFQPESQRDKSQGDQIWRNLLINSAIPTQLMADRYSKEVTEAVV